MEKVAFYPNSPVTDSEITEVTVVLRYKNKWIFYKNPFWKIPSSKRNGNEPIDQTAKRILNNYATADGATLNQVGTYCIRECGEQTYGTLFFAEIEQLLQNVQANLFEIIPTELLSPNTDPILHKRVQDWINLQTGADELWDIYDENRNLTGKLHRRGDYLAPGDYHLSVSIWMINSRGEFLMTKRSPNKGFPNMWETTGGSAIAGDDSLTAALREVREETGLTLCPEKGICLFQFKSKDTFSDIWLFRQDFDLADVKLLEGETCDVMYATKDTIRKLDSDGLLVPYSYLDQLFEIV